MGLFLRNRAVHLTERMDDPNCDLETLRNTYQYFLAVNSTLGRWKYVYKKHISPMLANNSNLRLLDIGCGGGDILWMLAKWMKRDGFQCQLTGIDPDDRAISFAKVRKYALPVGLRSCSTSDLLAEKCQPYDVVISNHVLHHLTDEDVGVFLGESKELAAKKVIHCDLVRNDLAYFSYPIVSFPAQRNSFLMTDGLISIRKSFIRREIEVLAGKDWKFESIFPFRYALLLEK